MDDYTGVWQVYCKDDDSDVLFMMMMMMDAFSFGYVSGMMFLLDDVPWLTFRLVVWILMDAFSLSSIVKKIFGLCITFG